MARSFSGALTCNYSAGSMTANGSERLDHHGGRRLTVSGVGLIEVFPDGKVITLEPLSPAQQERLDLWLEHEWPTTREKFGGYAA